jgi:hypothetical protein
MTDSNEFITVQWLRTTNLIVRDRRDPDNLEELADYYLQFDSVETDVRRNNDGSPIENSDQVPKIRIQSWYLSVGGVAILYGDRLVNVPAPISRTRGDLRWIAKTMGVDLKETYVIV